GGASALPGGGPGRAGGPVVGDLRGRVHPVADAEGAEGGGRAGAAVPELPGAVVRGGVDVAGGEVDSSRARGARARAGAVSWSGTARGSRPLRRGTCVCRR